MKTKLFFLAAAAAMAFTAISCSKDDGDPSDPGNKVPDPEGTVELNMRNADNGKTSLIGIYIDAGNNFTEGGFTFVDLGAMKGLGNITKFTTTGGSGSCAVIPGHGYLAYSSSYVFPSGATAYSIYYVFRIYVDSYILSAANTILGAKIKYQKPFNPYGLPLTWEEFQSANPEERGWEVENIYYKNELIGVRVRSNNMYVSLYK